uniref:RNA-directed RNA polymerase n=1 Tax=Gordis virus TaxID=2800918 RepID=A0A894KPV4_9MONO|nr:MAG: RNA-dependent RNA polymerase [Gordis virus]
MSDVYQTYNLLDPEDDGVFSYFSEIKGEKRSNAEKGAREKASIAGHLCAPIYGAEVDLLMKKDPDLCVCFRHKKLFPKFKECRSFRELEDPISVVQDWLETIVIPPRVLEGRKKAMLYSARNWVIQKVAMSKPLSPLCSAREVKQYCDEKLGELEKRFSCLEAELRSMIKAEIIKDNICFKDIGLGELLQYGGGKFERDLSSLMIGAVDYLFPTNLILCGLDKTQSLFGLKLYWLLVDIFQYYPGFSILETGSSLYKKFLTLRRKRRDGFFSFMASWEPLIVGSVVNRSDDLGCSALYMSQHTEMSGYLEDSRSGLIMKDFLPKGETENETRMFLDLIGMVKIMGYPTLVESKLLDQLREHGTTDAHIDNEVSTEVDALTRRNFLLRYYSARNCYPKLSHCPRELIDYIKNNRQIPVKIQSNLKIWENVVFGKVFDFDFGADLSDRIKDSACALNYSAWGRAFDRCAFKSLYGKSPPPSSSAPICRERRVIDAFLKANPDIIRSIFFDREQGIYDPEDHVIFQCGKELEQKENSGRAFTKQTEYQRFFQVSLEHAVAECILPFVPEQSMTDGEVKIANKHMSHLKSLGGASQLINFDLQKWCLRHRVGNVRRIGKMYDELFGLNGIFENSHDFFLYVPTFCNNRFSPPDYDDKGNPIPGPYFLNDFLGGNEGMHQKKWTHASIGIFNLALEKCRLKGTIMCQGDNIIIILHFDPDQVDKSDVLRSSFLNTINGMLEAMNHKLKEKETWYSKHLHEYGKQRVYKGVAISGGTKKATKIIPDINDGLSSYHSCISSLNTTTEAIAKVSFCADLAFIINQVMVANFLIRKGFVRPDELNSIRRLLLCPADFGGLPLSSYMSHSVRGHDDHVTSWLCVALTLKEHYPSMFKEVVNLWQLVPARTASSSKDRSRLYEDPYCLNIKSLPSADSKIRDLTLAYLKSDAVTNPNIRRLYSEQFSMSYDSVIASIDKMRPIYAPLGNVLLKSSNAGIGKMLQGKLTSSKTIEKAVSRQTSLLELIDLKNSEMVEATKKLARRGNFLGNITYFKDSCPVVIADKLREKSWGVDLVGVTKPPYQHQVVLQDLDDVTDSQRNRTIVIKLSPDVQENPAYCHKTFGPFKPYVGSRTKEKITKASIDVTEKTSYIRAAQTLGKMKSWLELIGAKGLVELCDKLIQEKLDVIQLPESVENIEDICAKVRSGNIYHRMSSDVEHSVAMVNCLLTVTSHYSQSSNLLQSLTQDGEDFTVFFQLVYAANIYLLSSSSCFINKLPAEVACVLECIHCTKLLPPTDFDIHQLGHIDRAAVVDVSSPSLSTRSENVDICLLLEIVLGMEFSNNIEANYAANHAGSEAFRGTALVAKAQVSINDLRKCRLDNVILAAFIFSPHCHQLMFEDNEILINNSNDLSFVFMAETIINSDRREDLFQILGRSVPEHTMVTRSERMSAFISRSVKNYLMKNYEKALELLTYTFRDDVNNWRCKNALSAMIGFGGKMRLGWRPWKIAKQHLIMGNLAMCKKKLGISHVVPKISRDEVITCWRANRLTQSLPQVVPERIIVDYSVDLSLLRHDQYYHDRCSDEELLYDYKFLSFLARPIVVISSAANKYLEILMALGALKDLERADTGVYCLAEGSSGTKLILTLLSKGPTYYNTLMRSNVDNRDSSTDFKGPSCVVGGINESREPNRHKLASGETDILTAEFRKKLMSEMSLNPPFLVTMDAESNHHGSNVEFVRWLVPSILGHNPRLVIFKLFLVEGLSHILTGLLEEFSGYQWVLFKPISSSPTSREIFLVITHISLQPYQWGKLVSCHNKIQTIPIEKLSRIGKNAIESYLAAAYYVNERINALFVGEVPTFGDRVVVQGACGFCCHLQLRSLIDALDRCHLSDGDSAVNIVVRAGGTNSWLFKQSMDLIFMVLTLTRSDAGLVDILEVCRRINVVASELSGYRAKVSRRFNSPEHIDGYIYFGPTMDGNYLTSWNDVKFFMRNWKSSPCSHPLETIIKPNKSDLHSSLSYNLIMTMRMVGICSRLLDFMVYKDSEN